MASDGAALSLDDYIKVKRKQGAFKGKGVRGRGGISANATAHAGRRKAKFVTMKGKRGGRGVGQGVKGQGRGGRVNQGTNRRGRNFGARGGRGRGTVRNNYTRQLQPQHYANVSGGGGVANNFRQGRIRGQGQRTRNFGRNRNFGVGVGVSQHLAGGGRRQRQRPVAHAVSFVANRRSVMKLAKKRVARARAQLNRQKLALVGSFGGVNRRIGRGKGPGFRTKGFLPLLSVASGVRRTRSGFVTVSNPLEKRAARLAVKEKIQKARAIRLNRGNFNAAGNSRNAVAGPAASGPSRQRQGQRPRQQSQAMMQQQSPIRRPTQSLYNSRSPMRRQEPRRPRQEYYASTPPRSNSMTMYADAEPGGWRSRQNQVHDSPPLMRTMVNNSYDPRHPSLDYDYGVGHGVAPVREREILNPEIQRKINFIQSHGSRGPTSGSGSNSSPGIIPDFRAPPISSTMKLSDRFRLYMN